MPDINIILNYLDPIILGICLTGGYVLKTAFDKFPNKFIPLAGLAAGTVLALVSNLHNGFDIEILLRGMTSGLASTGMYEMLRNLLNWDEKKALIEEEKTKVELRTALPEADKAVMTEKEREVMRKIIYAVETGGQVYGQARYDDFTEAYTNSETEHAITIGAGQWYGTEAKELLQTIREKDPDGFKDRDTAGIAADLDKCDWSCYRQSKKSAKAVCIQNIIKSKAGCKCQDMLMDRMMEQYVSEAADLGVNDMDAKMMCANFRHQGGYSAMERVIHKTKKPYTLDHVYGACLTDTGNQVGAYRSRQKMVFESLQKYIGGKSITKHGQAAVDLAKSRVGKNTYTQSESRTKVFKGYSDCSSLVWKCFERAYGIYVGSWTGEQVERGRRILLCQHRGSYGRLAQGEIKKMQPGDCIYYGSGDASHVEMYIGGGQQIGHGSGQGPTIKNCLEYGHPSGVYQVRRFVADDGAADPEIPDVWKAVGTAVSTADNVNVRDIPAGEILRIVNKGDRFEVDGNVINGWTHVKAENVIGYIYSDYVEADAPAGEDDDHILFIGRVTAEVLNVRCWYGLDAEGEYYPQINSCPELERGELTDVLVAYQYDGDTWYKVRIHGKYTGFVHGGWIEPV